MRQFVLDPSTPPEMLRAARPPDAIRGAISRRMIADKTGLPRETVRRKTAELATAGLVVVDADDRVRITQMLDDADLQNLLADGHAAVLRYLERLRELGVDWSKIGR